MDREKVNGFELCTNGEPCMGEKFLRCPFSPRNNAEQNCGVTMARNALDLLKEREAEWIYGEDETGVDGWHCSYCGFFEPWFYEFTDDIDFIRFYSFCPGCGRRMSSYTGKPTQEGR